MSASLVGSEMCIRDRASPLANRLPRRPARPPEPPPSRPMADLARRARAGQYQQRPAARTLLVPPQ
eukprot:7144978-Alexandrium_andersonii.AAC.1